jgi:iron(III) transport system ATP-binding protein
VGLTNSAALQLEQVTKRFGAVTAVENLSLEVAPGEIVSLIGPSGCGKTTALRLVAGLELPDTGVIQIGGTRADRLPPEQRSAGFVFQDYALFPHLTVEENVAFGLAHLPREDRRSRLEEVLELVDLRALAARLPFELSGGQQQRVAIARALAPKPRILLLDEPFSNLDPTLRRQVRHEVLEIVRLSGTATLWVTHDHDEGLIVAERVVVMDQGRVRQVGTPSEIWRYPADSWVAAFIGTGDLIDGVVEGGFVRTTLGRVKAAEFESGRNVQVLIRPDDVVLASDGAKGKVVRRHFVGTDNVYCVQLEDGCLLHCRQPADVEIHRGTTVRIRLANHLVPIYA